MTDPEVLWRPRADVLVRSRIGHYLAWLDATHGRRFASYDELWRWSVDDLPGFWGSVWEHFAIQSASGYERVIGNQQMPGASWFPGARLNYAQHALRLTERSEADVVVIAHSQTRPPMTLSVAELRDRVSRARAGLQRLGVGRGDRVAAYLPNVPEAVVAFLATASLGAIWSSCAPEFGDSERRGSAEPDRAKAAAHDRRLSLWRGHGRPDRRGGRHPRRAPHPRRNRRRPLPRHRRHR